MGVSTEMKFKQLVLAELAGMIADDKNIRVSFAPGTETHRQLKIISTQKNVEPRDVVISAVRVFFLALMGTNNEQSID